MESQRLKFRRFTLADLDNMVELETDPDVMRFTPSRIPLSKEKIQQRLKARVEKEKTDAPFGVWATELKDSNDFVGWICLLKTGLEFPELGFMIVKRHWRKGFTTEAALRLIQHGFRDLKLTGILAKTDEDNQVSKAVLTKLGFRKIRSETEPDSVLKQPAKLDYFELLAL